MKFSNRNLAIIGGIVIVAIAGVILLRSKNSSSKVLQPTASPSPTTSASPTPAVDRAKIRAEFISSCTKMVGQNHLSECNCTADYLSAHYNDIELAKLYVEYHSSNKVPAEIKTAVQSCTSK